MQEAAPAPEATAATRRVLVVDDNHDAADTLAMMVRLLGHETRAVYDPRAVEDEVASFAPEVVFLDVGMPGRSGYDVARALRTAHGDALVIVAVTGWGQPEDRLRTLQETRRRHMAARNRLINELQRLTNPRNARPNVTEAEIKARLTALQDLEARSAGELRRAYDSIDEVLDVRQQARFRVFEEQIERRKLDLISRARQNRPQPQRKQPPPSH